MRPWNAALRALIRVKLRDSRLPEADRRHDQMHVWSIWIRIQNPHWASSVHGTMRALQMRFLDVAVIHAIVGVLLVSSGVASVGPTIGSANAGPAPAADATPVVARSRPEVQRSVLEDRDRGALGLLLLLGMFESRRGP
jgi:hypothetical protein